MSDKKHIDRLFQEHLKNLDETPTPEVWAAIENELHKKKKKNRVIPIWWRVAGAAAILLLFLALGNVFFNTNNNITNSTNVVIEDSTPKTNSTKSKVVNSTTASEEEETKPSKIVKPSPLKPTDAIVTTKSTKEASENLVGNKPSTSNTPKVSPSASNKNKAATAIALSAKEEPEPPHLTEENSNIISEPTKQNTSVTPQIATHANEQETHEIPEVNKIAINDTLTIEDAIAETKPKENIKSKKWDVNPNIAPVYYNAAGTGSHLDDQFVNNSKTGEINTSYGVSVGYTFNNKLKIRSGVNSLKLSFNTNDVVIYENTATSFTTQATITQIKHVSKPRTNTNLAMVSANNVTGINNNTFLKESTNAIVNQNINYFEVPLELEYAIINKRFGLNIIGGFSTFFLNDNSVYTESNISRTYIGEANNLNDVSFSTNFGIGVDYNFSKRIKFNLEPTVKYQLNAYNQTSGSFRPYILGVYTGFSYKF